jgi:hypothetical protein
VRLLLGTVRTLKDSYFSRYLSSIISRIASISVSSQHRRRVKKKCGAIILCAYRRTSCDRVPEASAVRYRVRVRADIDYGITGKVRCHSVPQFCCSLSYPRVRCSQFCSCVRCSHACDCTTNVCMQRYSRQPFHPTDRLSTCSFNPIRILYDNKLMSRPGRSVGYVPPSYHPLSTNKEASVCSLVSFGQARHVLRRSQKKRRWK